MTGDGDTTATNRVEPPVERREVHRRRRTRGGQDVPHYGQIELMVVDSGIGITAAFLVTGV